MIKIDYMMIERYLSANGWASDVKGIRIKHDPDLQRFTKGKHAIEFSPSWTSAALIKNIVGKIAIAEGVDFEHAYGGIASTGK